MATDGQLKLLAQLLHQVVSGKIPIEASSFEAVSKLRGPTFDILTDNFEKRQNCAALIRSGRRQLLPTLKQLAPVYAHLLEAIFESSSDTNESDEGEKETKEGNQNDQKDTGHKQSTDSSQQKNDDASIAPNELCPSSQNDLKTSSESPDI